MSRWQGFDSFSYYLADDRRGFGRDDPIWLHYVKEANKWDAELIEGWHKSMDTPLLFATLFSAIVTAFLIESCQNLKPDYAEITAMGVVTMLEYIRNSATNQVPNATDTNIPSVTEFQPTQAALVINIAWFLSLTLSISVALLAMLIKQWSQSFRSGTGLAPPCVEARIRQSRYNKLISWRAEDIVMSLPVLMHIALGLFLFGLILFLLDLNRAVFIPVAIVVAIIFLVYLSITLLPLFVAFCPYNTPLSSRRLWKFCFQLCNLLVPRSWQRNIIPSSQLEENYVCESTHPDDITVQAVEWLICHSDREVIDIAIKAISNAALDIRGWTLLARGSLCLRIVRKFIAICGEPPHQGSKAEAKKRERYASMYGRALANLSTHAELQPISRNGIAGYSTGQNFNVLFDIDEEQVQAVESGLVRLASSKDFTVSAHGITGLSSWYISTSRSTQTRDMWKKMVNQLIQLLSLTRNTGHGDESHALSNHPEIQIDLVRALAVEISHWRWELNRHEVIEILETLVSLYHPSLLAGPAKKEMSAVLAVFALLFNDYEEIPPSEACDVSTVEGFLQDARTLYQKKTEKYVEQNGDLYRQTSKPQRVRRRSWRAQTTALLCARNSDYLEKYSGELLLFGLVGLLDSFAEVQLKVTETPSSIAQLVAAHLMQIPIASQSQAVTLPWVLPSTFDIKLYTVDVITRVVSPSPLGAQEGQLSDDDKAALLQCLSETNIWAEFGHQILMPVLKLLNCADVRLQTRCVIALREYCLGSLTFDEEPESHPNPVDWTFIFSFEVLYRLIRIVEEGRGEELVSRAVSALHAIVQLMLNAQEEEEAMQHLGDILKRIVLDGLFDTFVTKIACQAGYPSFKFLREQVIALPKALKRDARVDVQILAHLDDFCGSHRRESGPLAILLINLKSEIDAVKSAWNDHTTSADPPLIGCAENVP